MNKKKVVILLNIIFILFILCSIIPELKNSIKYQNPKTLKNSSILNTFEGVEITELFRNVELRGDGLLTAEDTFTIKNVHNNALTFITVGIEKSYIDKLINYVAQGSYSESLTTQFSEEMIGSFKMLYIYFDTPLFPSQETIVTFTQTYKDLYNFSVYDTPEGIIESFEFNFYIYPTVPYEIVHTGIFFVHPERGETIINLDDSGENGTFTDGFLQFTKDSVEPLYYKSLIGSFEHDLTAQLQIENTVRKITFNSLGFIMVEETHTIHNTGAMNLDSFIVKIPSDISDISEIEVYDYLGPIQGARLATDINEDGKTKDLTIVLTQNRISLTIDSKFEVSLRYQLPYNKHHIFNWLENSISIDLFLVKSDFILYNQEIQVIIDGCENIVSITEQPDSIETRGDDLVLIYKYNMVPPLEENHINIIYILNFLEILMRPLIFTVIFMLIFTSFVILTKVKKPELSIDTYRKKIIPINELRQFYTLYEEKNALFLDIQQADDNVKRKKLSKKKYLSMIQKYETKIKSLDNELPPLRKTLEQSTKIFEDIFKKLELLEAERYSLKDNINLLENRYRRGKLPSKRAYEKLLGDFLKRRGKVRKAIDRQIHELKAYLY